MRSSAENIDIVNVRITHKTADVPLLEAVAFKEKRDVLNEIRSLGYADECVLLQTCNRLEFFLVNKDGEYTSKMLRQYLANRAGATAEEASRAIEISMNHNALKHILRIASGLESMVVGG